MEKTHLLLSLPTDLSARIVSLWLRVADRVHLDSACCNQSTRERFLALNSSPECSLPTWIVAQGPTDDLVRWASSRSVSVANIYLNFGRDSASNLDLYEAYLRKFGGGVLGAKAEGAPSKALSMIGKLCPNLLVLDCEACDISPVLREVFEYCPNLRELRCNFEKSPKPQGSKSKRKSKVAAFAGLSCPNLKVVQLMICDDAELIAGIVRLAAHVEVLMLLCCGPNFTLPDDAIDSISASVNVLSLTSSEVSPQAFDRLVRRCRNIQHLDLSSCNVTPEGAAALGTHLTRLESVDVSYSDYVTDEVLCALTTACGDRLTELLMCQCYNVDQNAVDAVVLQQCPNLTSFSTNFIDPDGDLKIDWSVLKTKTSLHLGYEGARGQGFIAALGAHCSSLQHCSLSLCDLRTDENGDVEDSDVAPPIDMRCVDELVRNCPDLHSLAIEFEDYILEAVDIARWQALRPGLVVRNKFQVELTALHCLRRDCFDV